MADRPQLQVAAGILCDAASRVLIAERRCDGPLNGLWEFPGGKRAPGETALAALRRELSEELGIRVLGSRPFMDLRHEYPDRIVELEFFMVTSWRGEPRGREGQQLRWVPASELDSGELLPADAAVVEALRAR